MEKKVELDFTGARPVTTVTKYLNLYKDGTIGIHSCASSATSSALRGESLVAAALPFTYKFEE